MSYRGIRSSLPLRRYATAYHDLPSYGLLDAFDQPELLRVVDDAGRAAPTPPPDRLGLSPLRWATGQFGLLDALHDTGASSSAKSDRPGTPIRFIGRYPRLSDGPQKLGMNGSPTAAPGRAQDGPVPRDFLPNLGERVVDSFAQAGKNLWTGYRVGASGIYDTLGNAVGLLNGANDFMTEWTGVGQMSEGTMWKDAEDWLHAAAAHVSPTPDDLPQDIAGKIYAGIGQAPAELAQLLPAMRLLGPTLGAASIGGVREADQGWKAAAAGAAKTGLLGYAAKALAPLSWIERSAGLGSLGAASSFGQSNSPGEAFNDAVAYGLLGITGIPKARQPNLLPLRMAHDEFIDAANHAQNRLDVIRGLSPKRRQQEIVRINNAPGVLLEDVARTSDRLRGYKVKPGGRYELPPLPGMRDSRIYDYRRSKSWTPTREVEVKRERAKYPEEQRRADEHLEEQSVRIDRRRENEILKRARIQLGKEGRFDAQAAELARYLRRQIRGGGRPD